MPIPAAWAQGAGVLRHTGTGGAPTGTAAAVVTGTAREMNFVQQLSAIFLLIDFLFGATFGVVGGAVIGSRRGALLWPASDGLLSAGARVIYGVYIRDDDGSLRRLLQGGGQASGKPPGDDGSGSHGQEPDR